MSKQYTGLKLDRGSERRFKALGVEKDLHMTLLFNAPNRLLEMVSIDTPVSKLPEPMGAEVTSVQLWVTRKDFIAVAMLEPSMELVRFVDHLSEGPAASYLSTTLHVTLERNLRPETQCQDGWIQAKYGHLVGERMLFSELVTEPVSPPKETQNAPF